MIIYLWMGYDLGRLCEARSDKKKEKEKKETSLAKIDFLIVFM